MIRAFYPFAKKKFGFDKPVRLFLRHDSQNALDPLGKTAFYDPEQMSVTVYTSDRHPKDIIRSIAHELVHHKQNCEGRLTNINTDNITEDSHLKTIEEEAYRDGNSCFREWEDTYKKEKKLMNENKDNSSKVGKEDGNVKDHYIPRASKIAEQVAKKFGFKFDFSEPKKEEQKGGDSK